MKVPRLNLIAVLAAVKPNRLDVADIFYLRTVAVLSLFLRRSRDNVEEVGTHRVKTSFFRIAGGALRTLDDVSRGGGLLRIKGATRMMTKVLVRANFLRIKRARRNRERTSL